MNHDYQSKIEQLSMLFHSKGLRNVCIKTYGCQQNVNDSEKIAGLFCEAGCEISDIEHADIVVFNTCAVRENAEDRVFGHVGALKVWKEENPSRMILLGGCMVQQEHISERIRESYPYVDVLFNTNALDQLPGLILRRSSEERRIFDAVLGRDFEIQEDLPAVRDGGYRALLPIMYGCDNFCSYCVVPYVRGKERSRSSSAIIEEFTQLVNEGYKDIMLLGQNVNSYGKHLDEDINFSKLLRLLNDIEGDFVIRFMTSHPKDATIELFDTIADCQKISRNIHLPVQSGSNKILKEMNRGYSRESYLELIREARKRIDGVTFTSDIIIGFPGETEEDYQETVSLIKEVGFYSLFTFIYSKRKGTKAADLPDDTPHKMKADRLIALTEIQDQISEGYDRGYIGKTLRGIAVEELTPGEYEVRLDNNSVIIATGSTRISQFCQVKVTGIIKRRLYGEFV